MAIKILNGKEAASELQKGLRVSLEELNTKPFLATVLVGENSPSEIYVRIKKRACEKIGITNEIYRFNNDETSKDLRNFISFLNHDREVHGILIQLPLPPKYNELETVQSVNPRKDVDGFHFNNVGKLACGFEDRPGIYYPATPAGILALLKHFCIPLAKTYSVVVGRSNIVGRPLSRLLELHNSTVTLCHSKTQEIPRFTREADILISAVGQENFITKDMVKKGSTIIDVGTNRRKDGSLTGDVDFENVKDIAGAISPSPGGVGPMTVTMLMHNVIQACKYLEEKYN
ncbi:MAG: bifunctional 5,10-methylenetetrahydrofolate dehydrogenase/5,10-methenyltetrahydrofolate cyclohydrolase [Candidatus Hodarchaeota archaeon]